MWGHKLLQGFARTIRVEKGKVYGKIIDYYGITRNLVEALGFDEREIDEALTDIAEVKNNFVEAFDGVSALFAGVNTEDPSMANLRACLKLFEGSTDKQEQFEQGFKKLRALFELLSPDPFLKPYVRKVEWLACFYVAFQKEFNDDLAKLDVYQLVAEYGPKLRALVQEKVDYEGITRNYREMRVDQVAELEKRYGDDEEGKAKNLERLLKSEITINLDTHPLFRSFAERLEAIRREFESHQLSLIDRIKQYEELLGEVKKANDKAGELGLTLKEYALYGFSEEFISEVEQGVLKEYVKELSAYLEDIIEPAWQESTRREDLLKDIKRTIQQFVLQDYKGRFKVKEFPKYLNRLIDIIVRKF